MSTTLRAGSASDAYIQVDAADVLPLGVQSPKWQDFRLTLTSGVPVTTTNVTGATTVYCTPYVGNIISLYNGTIWRALKSNEFSIALGTLVSGRPYDVFCYDNAGVPTLELLAWTNDTTRATALAYQDGVLVKSGTPTRRYLGTFYTTSTTTTEDSTSNRYLWNYYHRVMRSMSRIESTATWTYTLATWRQANASTSNQLNYIQGVAEDNIDILVIGGAATAGGATWYGVGVGVDSTSVNSGIGFVSPMTAAGASAMSMYNGIPGAGKHYIAWLEYSNASGTTTWYGTGAAWQTGMKGNILA